MNIYLDLLEKELAEALFPSFKETWIEEGHNSPYHNKKLEDLKIHFKRDPSAQFCALYGNRIYDSDT